MRKQLIDRGHPQLSIRRQAALVSANRNRLDCRAPRSSEEDARICGALDPIHLKRPYFGSRRLADELRANGLQVGRDRVRRLMRQMGIRAICARPRTSRWTTASAR